jgi:hypothetical protein
LAVRDSRCSWVVVLDDATGSVVTGRRTPVSEFGLSLSGRRRHPSHVVRRPAGYLVGYNRGEWGGSLNWYTPQGAPGGVLLVDNVVDIIPGPPSTVVLTGLAHLGGDYGYLVELDEADGAFRIGRRVSLGSAPHAAMREASGSILVATHDGLLRIAPSHAIEDLVRYADGGLYATSIAIDAHGVIYVGMRGAVARFTPAEHAYREQWLVAVALPS